ncbi:hypothetical protein K432DRAFT_381451 [Lepidopterella palustris CBS 459.81]|uniref:Erythromycin esterase n=1 Tax=Lepidopterella palustris CBS 459.81 TaxID=1314670 RepID=A0A8E2JG59_9PEZI|nr:hypothetical protein K432DRAFT_381451 [Lepidopterella palustris CBS 459.81]
MAKRRSARLQKGHSQSPGIASPPPPLNPLPSVIERDEVPAAPTPSRISCLTSITTRTPRNRTPIKPTGEEMHPHHHQTSTAKPLEEARWLGFLSMGAHTAPAGGSNELAIAQATPTKAHITTPIPFSTPEFKFRYKRPSMNLGTVSLSPEACRMMEEARDEAKKIRSQMVSISESTSTTDQETRKIAVPKGKAGRFSDVHMAQFKKMDSIANHPSSFRANPSRFKPVTTSLKRSPSKAELDKVHNPTKATPTLKRTQSRAKLNKHTVGMSRPTSTAKSVASRDEEAFGPAKRMKRHENDDVSATRPGSRDSKPVDPQPTTPRGPSLHHSHTGIPRLGSRLFTPTKASLARSQSVKTVKNSMIPSLMHSPSTRTLTTPKTFEDSLKAGVRKTSHSLLRIPGVKSILRTPNRKFSNDPMKIAAGTHMSPPPGLDIDKELRSISTTAPVHKQVNFTASTVAKAEKDDGIATPSRVTKVRASSEVPQMAIAYPTLLEADQSPFSSPSRRQTLGELPQSIPGNFTFRSDKAISFGPATSGTIRHVRSSDVHENSEPGEGAKKRKLESVDEGSSEKENDPEEDGRANKRTKANPVEATKTPVSKLPRRQEKRPGSLSRARLSLLATPKRRKT